MKKHDIADRMAAAHNVTKAKSAAIVSGVLCEIVEALMRGEEVRLDGFGTFAKHHRPAGEARNPRTGEPVQVAAKDVPKFRPSRTFTAALNG